MTAWPLGLAGRLDPQVFRSTALRGNPLGDPPERPLEIYLPPGYDDEPDRRYPSIYMIQGYTGSLPMWHNRSPFRRTFPESADALFAAGDAPPCILVWVDAWTAYGGSQFVDSPGTGRYHTYLCDEVVPWVDDHYRTLPAAAHRGIAGKSSGGFGAVEAVVGESGAERRLAPDRAGFTLGRWNHRSTRAPTIPAAPLANRGGRRSPAG